MAEIKLLGLAHSYLGSPKVDSDYAIRPLDHTWPQGGTYALLGPSGCGKSTLLSIISGLLTPSEGKVLFDGQEVNHVPPEKRNIAQVFQFPVIYDTMTVFDNLAFPLRNQRVSEEKIRIKVKEVAEVLELTSLLRKKAKGLTADEKQKVSLGRGLVRDDVSAILFDEPLTVIDPHLKGKLRRKLKQIHKQFNITMVYVTHDQLEASTFADKIAVMYAGQIVQFGTPRELFENPQHTFVGYFIGSPGMNFIDAVLEGDFLVLGKDRLPIKKELASRLRSLSPQRLQIGIRPEFVRVAKQHHEHALHGKVLGVEDRGTYKILTVELGTHRIKARLDEDQNVPENEVLLEFPEARLKLYADSLLVEV
ncbi:MAG TPA: ABC transporter ATP-binding protein [Oligoflexus sp.]|uniref:ABC transporter ATP-binding protein n=1 Tax=Oligoflexus sp. TaxID=1971216 RepID=UPI002D50C40A|nr:ABC transporter ATP-binding protein [Oligoflexus sp.]HYX36292.1 ABC transporter ATP-binding protein [Oligoflexus sp.]